MENSAAALPDPPAPPPEEHPATSAAAVHADAATSQRLRHLANSAALSDADAPSFSDVLRDARREVADKVRDDWVFPAGSGSPEAQLPTPTDDVPSQTIEPGVRYLPRSYSSSSDSSSPTPPPPSRRLRRSSYKFDSPDSVAASLAQRAARRRKRRRQANDAELAWNEGLRHWTAQRDAWTRSITATMPPAGMPAAESEAEELIPLSAPILPPTHPNRAAITPAAYPTLYSKVVVKGQTPNVPINLPHIINSLVQGWKADDQWPPRPTAPPEPAIGRRKATPSGTQGVDEGGTKYGVFGVLGISSTRRASTAGMVRRADAGATPAAVVAVKQDVVSASEMQVTGNGWVDGDSGMGGPGGETADAGRAPAGHRRRSSVARGVGAMKKALGLGGGVEK